MSEGLDANTDNVNCDLMWASFTKQWHNENRTMSQILADMRRRELKQFETKGIRSTGVIIDEFLKETKDMKIEVGKEYMCGDIRVRAVGEHTSEGSSDRAVVCLECKHGYSWLLNLTGVFWGDVGRPGDMNPDKLQHDLTEIPKEIVKEMTVAEVGKALGIENLKIVK